MCDKMMCEGKWNSELNCSLFIFVDMEMCKIKIKKEKF